MTASPSTSAGIDQPDDLVCALERHVQARSVEATWEVLLGSMLRYGFDRLIYGLTRSGSDNGLGPRSDMLVLSNHGKDYIEPYMANEMYLNAPMVDWALRNHGEMSWSYLGEIADALSSAQKKVLKFNALHGVTAGYTISFADGMTRHRAAIALTAPRDVPQSEVDRIWRQFGRQISLICHVAHLRLSCLPWPATQNRLTDRQREVLEWVGDGKTISDVATILGLNPATIEKHLRNARAALGADTTAQALVKAAIQRQIFTVRPTADHKSQR